ncbi:hypothetical protein [Streptomyces sp. NPDC017230]|uniref:hypothetical protein n=1 Tax=unclassified Streptomyces TaxID=2593676 RepID=UPI00378DB51C
MSLTVDSDLTVAWDITIDDAPVTLTARDDLVAVAGAAGTVRVLDAAMGAEMGALDLPGGVYCLIHRSAPARAANVRVRRPVLTLPRLPTYRLAGRRNATAGLQQPWPAPGAIH